MSDPLRTDPSRPLDASTGDRDAKIEQLLLLGLDHYFAAEYEQAINVWTRALFLDRTHPRARAYIDRARSALAERQRQSEELLHSGAAAFHAGDSGRARELLLAAIDGGANPDEASALLDRLTRLEYAAAAPSRSGSHTSSRVTPARAIPRRSAAAWALSALALGLIAGSVYVALDWAHLRALVVAEREAPPRAAAGPAPHEVAPAPPRRGELALARARTLVASGHLHDALDVLGAVRRTDPQRPDADRLRGEIQRQLIALTAMPPPVKDKGSRR